VDRLLITMHISLPILSALLASAWAASPTAHKPYTCHPFTIPIPVNNVTTIVPPFPELANECQATYISNLITQRDAPTPHPNLTTLTKTFNVEGAVCTPNRPNANTSTLYLATHGLGFNRSYWDFYPPTTPSDPRYSYIHAATAAGYTVLTYNRLGISPSSLANPYTEIQAPVELSILISLTTLARKGKIPGLKPPRKILHVGHSFGSELTLALAAAAPSLSDGIILTAFSGLPQYAAFFVASTSFHLANQNQPHRFPAQQYSNGYLTWSDKQANQYAFLAYPGFDPKVLEYAESTKYPFTIGELLTSGGLPVKAPGFKGPVLWLVGEHDLIFCGFDCHGLFGSDSVAIQGVNGSSSVEAVILEGVGHGINLHYNATAAYDTILGWAKRHA
jgi:pimeloyl-ACP methyl ester carboxylesterase